MSLAELLKTQPWKSRSLKLTPQLQRYPTMLSPEEQKMLAFLAAIGDFTKGAIVDLGPFMGGSTSALGHGLSLNPDARDTRIHSYDIFSASENLKQMFLYSKGHPTYEGTDIYPLFKSLTAQYPVVSTKGNIIKATWNRPIALLFIDLSKAWFINDHLMTTFFPHLATGAVIVQQDYMFFKNPWVASTMYKLRGHVDYAGQTDYNSMLFTVKKPLSDAVVQTCLHARTTHADIMAAFDWTDGLADNRLSHEMVDMMRAAFLANPGGTKHDDFPAVDCPNLLEAVQARFPA